MPRLTKDMYWLAQDIFCRYVAHEKLNPPGDIRQIAQTCIALTHEFFMAFEATQESLNQVDRKELDKAFSSSQAQRLATGLAMLEPDNGKPKTPAMPKDWQEPAQKAPGGPTPLPTGKPGGQETPPPMPEAPKASNAPGQPLPAKRKGKGRS